MIQSLRTFVIVAQTRSMSVAAKNLLYSPSSVTYHVRVLEKELGVRLIVKTDGRLEVTAVGHQILALGTELLRTADRMLQTAQQFRDSERFPAAQRFQDPRQPQDPRAAQRFGAPREWRAGAPALAPALAPAVRTAPRTHP